MEPLAVPSALKIVTVGREAIVGGVDGGCCDVGIAGHQCSRQGEIRFVISRARGNLAIGALIFRHHAHNIS